MLLLVVLFVVQPHFPSRNKCVNVPNIIINRTVYSGRKSLHTYVVVIYTFASVFNRCAHLSMWYNSFKLLLRFNYILLHNWILLNCVTLECVHILNIECNHILRIKRDPSTLRNYIPMYQVILVL